MCLCHLPMMGKYACEMQACGWHDTVSGDPTQAAREQGGLQSDQTLQEIQDLKVCAVWAIFARTV